jgi:hypothetical protein
MTADGIGNEGMGSEAAYRLKVEMKHVAAVGIGMNHEFADGNSSSTAFGAKLIEPLCAGSWTAIGGNVRRTHWGREDSITKCHLTQLDRACKIRVFVIVHIVLLFLVPQKYKLSFILANY